MTEEIFPQDILLKDKNLLYVENPSYNYNKTKNMEVLNDIDSHDSH